MKNIFIFLFLAIPAAVQAESASGTVDYSQMNMVYGFSLLIIIFFAIAGFLISRFIKKKLGEYTEKLEERYRRATIERKKAELDDLNRKKYFQEE